MLSLTNLVRGVAAVGGRRAFGMGLKRPKLSETFKFPQHAEYFLDDNYRDEAEDLEREM